MPIRILVAITFVALFASACGDGDDPAPSPSPSAESATPTSTATATRPPPDTTTPTEAASDTPSPAVNDEPLDHDVENALDHVRVLSIAIGPRVSGSTESRETVAYIANTLRGYGYAVEVMEFDYATRFRPATVTVNGETIAGIALNGGASPPQSVEGPAAGHGSAEEASLAGAISVRERTEAFPADVELFQAAALGGAAGLVIVNHPQWPYWGGQIPSRNAIPVVLVQYTEAARFVQVIEDGATIAITIGPTRPMAANVIARPAEGARCDILAGGHHDSVPAAPGALDNASGVAIVLELARAFAADGLDEGLCFATFGAEESGLFGSDALVRRWAVSDELPRIMVNFDVTARGDAIEVIGSTELVQKALALLEPHGIPAFASALPQGYGSDHQSFSRVGVPVLYFSDGDVSLIHTPEDVFEEIEPVALDRIGDAAALVMAALLAEIAEGP